MIHNESLTCPIVSRFASVSLASGLSCSASIVSASRIRHFTVPSGTSSTSAISRNFNCSYSRSTTTARCSSGSRFEREPHQVRSLGQARGGSGIVRRIVAGRLIVERAHLAARFAASQLFIAQIDRDPPHPGAEASLRIEGRRDSRTRVRRFPVPGLRPGVRRAPCECTAAGSAVPTARRASQTPRDRPSAARSAWPVRQTRPSKCQPATISCDRARQPAVRRSVGE